MTTEFDRRTAIKATVAAAAMTCVPQRARADQPVRHIRSRMGTFNTPIKQQAAQDYCRSLQSFGGRLSNPIRQLFLSAQTPDVIHFGVIVVGSGYGASICAARMSRQLRAEHRIAIVERGKEWTPGSFPDTMPKILGETRNLMTGPNKGQLNNPLGLFNVMMNREVNVLTGNGLGGGSLINASVALRPHSEVFEQSRWPEALRDVRVLGPYYQRVAQAISVSRTPFDANPKIRARRLAASRLSANPNFFDLPNVSVMYDHRHLDQAMQNPQGMLQRPCTQCGDCTTGCNIGAKNTLVYNYLPVAKWNGTEIYTQCEVERIEKLTGYYRVHMTYIDDRGEEITRHPVAVNTRMVVLGAGSPASATILLQSQSDELQFSPTLGQRWSANGDTIGFSIGMKRSTNIGGFGAYQPAHGPVGPTVQTSLNFYRDIELRRRLLIQEASIPRGVSNLFAALLADPALDHSMVMLGMGHDGAQGQIEWCDGRWQVLWPGLKDSEYRKMVFREFERLACAHGGKYKRLKAFGNNLVTVHPLGGCSMGDDPSYSTTNHLGQVYDRCQSTSHDRHGQIHRGLYVADGSLMPTALGVNPYMTIGALAERIARHAIHNPIHADLFESGPPGS